MRDIHSWMIRRQFFSWWCIIIVIIVDYLNYSVYERTDIHRILNRTDCILNGTDKMRIQHSFFYFDRICWKSFIFFVSMLQYVLQIKIIFLMRMFSIQKFHVELKSVLKSPPLFHLIDLIPSIHSLKFFNCSLPRSNAR